MLKENREFFLRKPEAGTELGKLEVSHYSPHLSLSVAAGAAGSLPLVLSLPPAPNCPSDTVGWGDSQALLGGNMLGTGAEAELTSVWVRVGVLLVLRSLLVS